MWNKLFLKTIQIRSSDLSSKLNLFSIDNSQTVSNFKDSISFLISSDGSLVTKYIRKFTDGSCIYNKVRLFFLLSIFTSIFIFIL